MLSENPLEIPAGLEENQIIPNTSALHKLNDKYISRAPALRK